MKTHWVMDYETLSNCFIAVFESVKSEEREVFTVHEDKNEITEFIGFLERNIFNEEWHVSFNGLGFDSQITEHILRNKDQLLNQDGETIARFIYSKAQDVIGRQNRQEFLEFAPKDLQVHQEQAHRCTSSATKCRQQLVKNFIYSLMTLIKNQLLHGVVLLPR